MKVARIFTLPKSLCDSFDAAFHNRSATMALAVGRASARPGALAEAFWRRIDNDPVTDPDTRKVSVSVDESFYADLANLSTLTRLPTEHVLRLAMEAHLHEHA